MELVSILFTGSVRHLENIGFYLELSQSAFQVWVKPKSEDLWLGKKKEEKKKESVNINEGNTFLQSTDFPECQIISLYTWAPCWNWNNSAFNDFSRTFSAK